jgi:hypothetical protein
MTRPDGLLLVAVSGAFKLGEAVGRIRAAEPEARPSLIGEAGSLVTWSAGFAALYAPYFVWRFGTYGWLFPNTYYAKVGSGIDQYERGLRYLAGFSQEYAAWLLLLAPLALALTTIRRAPALYVLALVAAWTAYVVYIGGDGLARFRFFGLVLPLFYALVASSGAALISGLAPGRNRWLVEGSAALAVAAMLAFMLQASGGDFGLPTERRAVEERAEMGRWLRDNVPDTTSIAVIPAGAIPYESRLTTIDMLGLNDEHIAHRDLELGGFAAGHEKYDSEYVLDLEPDIIILTDELSPGPWARSDYSVLGGGVIPARIDMLQQERLWSEYEPRSVRIREGKWFNLLVRHEAAAVLERTEAPGG